MDEVSVSAMSDSLIRAIENEKKGTLCSSDLTLIEKYMMKIVFEEVSYIELSKQYVGKILIQLYELAQIKPSFQCIFPSVDRALRKLRKVAYRCLFRRKTSEKQVFHLLIIGNQYEFT